MWQTIPNFSRYEISTHGEVRHRRHLRILKKSKPYNGYLQVGVRNDKLGRILSKCVHQLMALTFLGKKPPKYEVSHIDDNRENNKLTNLEYVYWTKNRPPRTIPRQPCKVCGEETTGICCSRECHWLYSRVLVQCMYCQKEFYRRKSVLKGSSPKRGYTQGRIFCSRKCNGLFNKGKPRPNSSKLKLEENRNGNKHKIVGR